MDPSTLMGTLCLSYYYQKQYTVWTRIVYLCTNVANFSKLFLLVNLQGVQNPLRDDLRDSVQGARGGAGRACLRHGHREEVQGCQR